MGTRGLAAGIPWCTAATDPPRVGRKAIAALFRYHLFCRRGRVGAVRCGAQFAGRQSKRTYLLIPNRCCSLHDSDISLTGIMIE